MQSVYVNAKMAVPLGDQYCTGNMYLWNNAPGGWIALQHSIAGSEPDHTIYIAPPSSFTWNEGILNVDNGRIVVDTNTHTISWNGDGWSGSAPCEWLAVAIDGEYVINEMFP